MGQSAQSAVAVAPAAEARGPASRGPATGHERYLAVRTFASLDGLRALSILAVIWHHAAIGRLGWGWLDRRGFLGVDLFFVISGFLIVTLLLRERRRTGGLSLSRFYARRTLRIFPLYFGVIGALAGAVLLLGGESQTRAAFAHDLPYLLTYTANWVPMLSLMAIAWSLAAEEQFYLLWPPLEKYLSRGAVLTVLGAFLLANEVVACVHLRDDLGLPAQFPPLDATLAPICLGVALAHLLHSPRGYAWARVCLGHPAAPVACLAGLVLVVGAAPWPDITGLPRLSMHLLMVALVGACVLREDHALRPLLALRPLARIGVISYGMYLLHVFALHAATVAAGRVGWTDPLVVFSVCLLLTLAAAEVSYRFYETPFLRLKALFAARRRPAAVPEGVGVLEPAEPVGLRGHGAVA